MVPDSEHGVWQSLATDSLKFECDRRGSLLKGRALGEEIALRTVQSVTATDNPALQCGARHAIDTPADHNFEQGGQRRRRHRGRSFPLGFNDEQMRRVLGRFGQHVEAVAAASLVCYCHRTQLGHENRV